MRWISATITTIGLFLEGLVRLVTSISSISPQIGRNLQPIISWVEPKTAIARQNKLARVGSKNTDHIPIKKITGVPKLWLRTPPVDRWFSPGFNHPSATRPSFPNQATGALRSLGALPAWLWLASAGDRLGSENWASCRLELLERTLKNGNFRILTWRDCTI